ncbi:MAG TPA: hypothetical protein VFM21_07270 [Terriglobia bacterium]|nr:hypothetical protein [Terriglobia bacterium]
MRWIVAGVVSATLLVGACSKSGGSAQERAVRAAVEAHLQKKGNLALNNMDMQIQNVNVKRDTADAQVKFTSKQNPQLAVNVQYSLRRAGDSWEVVSSTPMGGDSHQSMGSPGEGHGAPAGTATPQTPQPEASH